MDGKRRAMLKSGGGATLLGLLTAAGWLGPGDAWAQTWNKAAFDTHSLADTMKALGGADPAPSRAIVFFQTPEIGQNSARRPQRPHHQYPQNGTVRDPNGKEPNPAGRGFRHPRRYRPHDLDA